MSTEHSISKHDLSEYLKDSMIYYDASNTPPSSVKTYSYTCADNDIQCDFQDILRRLSESNDSKNDNINKYTHLAVQVIDKNQYFFRSYFLNGYIFKSPHSGGDYLVLKNASDNSKQYKYIDIDKFEKNLIRDATLKKKSYSPHSFRMKSDWYSSAYCNPLILYNVGLGLAICTMVNLLKKNK